MARAQAFNDWEDIGLGFGEDEVVNFNLVDVVERRLDRLIEIQNILAALAHIPDGLVETPRMMAKQCRDLATGLVRFSALGIEAPPDSDFNSLDREFIMEAQRIEDLYEWTIGIRTETEAWLRHHVTLMRRLPNQSKTQISSGNKVVNCVVNQFRTMTKWIDTIVSTPRKSLD